MTGTPETSTNLTLPSLTQIRAFYEVARLASISKASDELRRSQSAVTQAIQRLEEELREDLFVRTSTGSYLTDAGAILYRRAGNCFSRIERAIADIILDGDTDAARAVSMAKRVTRAQVRALVTVHEHGSFVQAARHAQVSLTSLQRSARTLEKQLGSDLFSVTPHGARVNVKGTRLSSEFLLAAREFDYAQEEMESRRGELRGQLLVGSLLLAGNPFIAIAIDRFIADFPEARIRLVHGSYDELAAKLQGGAIDFLVGLLKNPPPFDDLKEEALGLDPYLIATARTHPLASKSEVSLGDLRAFEWIAPRPTAQRRNAFGDIFRDGALPRYSVETHSLLTILYLLARGQRIALLTRSELAIDQRLGNQLVALNFAVDKSPASLGVTTRLNWEPTNLQRTFLSYLRTTFDHL